MSYKLIGLFIFFSVFIVNCNSSSNENEKVEEQFNRKQYDKVIESCNEILSKIKSKEALTYRGKAYHMLGKYEEAFRDFYYIYNTLGDTSIETFEGLGLSSLNLDQFEYASHLFEKLIQKDKNNPKNYFYMAIIYIKTKKPRKAINYINGALAIEPNNTKYLNNKGLLLQETGEFRESVECFSRILDNGNQRDTFYFNRAVSYGHIGAYDSSILDLSKAISLNSSNGMFYYNRAIVYKNNKEKEKACLDLEKAKLFGFLGIDDELINYCKN